MKPPLRSLRQAFGRPGGTDMRRLHCFCQSGNSFKVAFALRAMDLPYESVLVDFMHGQTRDAAWRAEVNNMGEAPVLDDGPLRLTQSGVILTHLAAHERQVRWSRRATSSGDPALAAVRQPQVHQLLRDLSLHEGVRRRPRPTRR